MAEQSTITVYALNGTNRKFTIPFEYLARRFVTVTLLGTSRTELEITSGFRFLSANQIETTQAWGSAQGYTNIEIRRNTSATQRLVDFYDGSVLRSRDLNVSAIQTIHIAEEARNMAGETLAEDIDGNLDARFRKVVNVQAGTVGGDAVNYGQVQEWSGSALNQADRALAEANRAQVEQQASTASAARSLASQNAAKVSETNSKTSETNSKTSETVAAAERARTETARNVTTAARDQILAIELTANAANTSAIAAKNAAAASQSAAKTSETNAKTSETNAKTSETNAKTSETNALAYRNTADSHRIAAANSAASIVSDELTSGQNAAAALASKNAAASSQGAALTSQNAAKASELLAAKWAENPTNTAVTAGKYSAKHWADKAMEIVTTDYLKKASNLSDLANVSTARTNLGLGNAAQATIGTGAGQVLTRESFGVGVATTFSGQSLNNATTMGNYFIPSTVGLSPSNQYPMHLNVQAGQSLIIQTITDQIGAKYQRRSDSAVWSEWSLIPVLSDAIFTRLVQYGIGPEAGDVSAYIFAQVLSGPSLQVGQNVSGSLLRVASGNGRLTEGFGPIAGTWRCQGYAYNPEEATQGLCSTLFVRVL